MDKKFRRLYLHEIAFNLIPQQVFFAQSKKYQGVKEEKHDFEMSMPSCRMCCTIMFHVQNHCYSIKLKAILDRYNI